MGGGEAKGWKSGKRKRTGSESLLVKTHIEGTGRVKIVGMVG